MVSWTKHWRRIGGAVLILLTLTLPILWQIHRRMEFESDAAFDELESRFNENTINYDLESLSFVPKWLMGVIPASANDLLLAKTFNFECWEYGDSDDDELIEWTLKRLARLRDIRTLIFRIPGRLRPDSFKFLSSHIRIEKLDLCCNKSNELDLTFLRKLPNMVELRITGGRWDASTVALLGRLNKLESLSISLSEPAELDLAFLKKLPKLTNFYLRNAVVSDANMDEISRCSNLTRLGLCRTELTERQLRQLNRLTNLWSLDLTATRVTGPGLNGLRTMPNLSRLNLSESPFGDDTVEYLADLPIDQLNLSQTKLTDAGLSRISDLIERDQLWLGTLELREARITESGIQEFFWDKHASILRALACGWR